MSQFKIYSSSAGSGKTYTLTKEYLKIALSNESPYYFRHILAITFTNDSANEMKHRIIQNLKNFAYPQWLTENEKKKSDFLLENISKEIGENPEKIRQRAKQVFTKILHNYADFAVSTIDKFVNRVVSVFTRELEIPYNYEVDMDTDQLLHNAIERVLEKVGRDEKVELSKLIMDWVKVKMEENQNWLTTGNELAHFAKNLMQENAYPFLNELKDFKMEDFQAIHKFISKEIKNIEKKIVQNAQDILNLFTRYNITANDLTGKSMGVFGFLNNLLSTPKKSDETIKKLPDQSEMSKTREVLNKTKSWFAKDKIPADWQNIIPELNLLLEEIFALGTQVEQYPLYNLIEPHIFKIALIQEIELEIAEVKRENNAIHISDTTKKISEIISTEPVPYIYERVGEKYHHILIDEFQDTSNLQWQNLLPLVENGLSEGNFNLIVGDGKQAIYRWRGGELEQLIFLHNKEWEKLQKNIKSEEELELLMQRYDTLAQYHSTESLNFNYRSRQEIINFNNDFFEFIKNSEFGEMYPMIAQVYDENFAQKAPQNALQGGNVEMFFLPKKDKKNKKIEDNTPQNTNFLADIHSEMDLNVDLMRPKTENSEEKTEKDDDDNDNDQKSSYNNSNDDENREIPSLNQEKTLEIILKCQEEGWLLGDIAVLVRGNVEGNAIANYLKQEGINVTSQNSLLLKSDNKILFIIALLKVFHQPDNKLAKSDALYLYHKIIKNKAPNVADNLEIKEILDKSIVKFYEKFQNDGYSLNLARLSALNLYELIEKLMGIFDLFNNQPKTEYLLRLLDVVLEFSLQKQATIAEFLEFWEKKKGNLSINAPADRNAVIITTIHKAKGLEYPIVIMPFTDWGYLPSHKNTVWVHFESPLTPKGGTNNPNVRGLRVGLVNLKKELQHTSLAPQYMAEKEKLFLESLNILYVGFTRPVHKLYILATLEDFNKRLTPKKKGEEKDFGDIPSVNFWLYLYLLRNNLWDDNVSHYILKNSEINPEKAPNDEENIFWVDELVVTDTHKTLKLNRKPDYSRIGHVLGVHS